MQELSLWVSKEVQRLHSNLQSQETNIGLKCDQGILQNQRKILFIATYLMAGYFGYIWPQRPEVIFGRCFLSIVILLMKLSTLHLLKIHFVFPYLGIDILFGLFSFLSQDYESLEPRHTGEKFRK